MYEIPKDTPFGTEIMSGVQQSDEGLIYIHGSNAKGYLVHTDYAKINLSPEAIKQGVPCEDFLSYTDKTTALILAHELPEQGFFKHLKKRERAANLLEMIRVCPEYARERNIQPPNPSKSGVAKKRNTDPVR